MKSPPGLAAAYARRASEQAFNAARIDCSHLIPTAAFANPPVMTIARISELDRRTTQSGKANSGLWLLEFEREDPLRADPLTGWAGSSDTKPQVRINFASKAAAIAYAKRHGFAYHLVPAGAVKLKLQAYADNFR